jgi:hypothetical protein
MGVSHEGHDVSDAGLMAHVFRHDLVQRVRICVRVSDEASVIIMMVPSELHFRVEGEMVTVFFQRCHMVTEDVFSAAGLRQDIGEQAVSHTDTEKTFHLGFGFGRATLPEALQGRQEKGAAGSSQNIATSHHIRSFWLVGFL